MKGETMKANCNACMVMANDASETTAHRMRFMHSCGAGVPFPAPAAGQRWRAPWGRVYGPAVGLLTSATGECLIVWPTGLTPIATLRCEGWELLVDGQEASPPPPPRKAPEQLADEDVWCLLYPALTGSVARDVAAKIIARAYAEADRAAAVASTHKVAP